MSLPPKTSDIAFEDFLQELPPEYWPLAFEFKAFCRARKVKSPAQLMQIVMSYCGLDQALRETAGTFTLCEESISDMGIHSRLKGCVPWIKAVLSEMMGQELEALEAGQFRLIVIDGSTAQGPGAKETWYRLHLALDLVKLTFVHAAVTDKHEGEHLDHYPLREGDVVVVDRGYNQPATLVRQGQKGVSLVLRYNAHSMNVYTEQCQKVDWWERLKHETPSSSCWPVRVMFEGEYLDAWVHAIRLPKEQAEAARRRCRARALKKGRTVQAKTLQMAEWLLVLSTIPPEVLSTKAIGELYRVRWQVELAIKRLKSLLHIDRLRAREGGQLAELYLHGKLLYAWVIEKRAKRHDGGQSATRLDRPRQATPWRIWKLVKQEVGLMISSVYQWNYERWAQCLAVMQERSRKRTLQTLPRRVGALIESCLRLSLCNPEYA